MFAEEKIDRRRSSLRDSCQFNLKTQPGIAHCIQDAFANHIFQVPKVSTTVSEATHEQALLLRHAFTVHLTAITTINYFDKTVLIQFMNENFRIALDDLTVSGQGNELQGWLADALKQVLPDALPDGYQRDQNIICIAIQQYLFSYVIAQAAVQIKLDTLQFTRLSNLLPSEKSLVTIAVEMQDKVNRWLMSYACKIIPKELALEKSSSGAALDHQPFLSGRVFAVEEEMINRLYQLAEHHFSQKKKVFQADARNENMGLTVCSSGHLIHAVRRKICQKHQELVAKRSLEAAVKGYFSSQGLLQLSDLDIFNDEIINCYLATNIRFAMDLLISKTGDINPWLLDQSMRVGLDCLSKAEIINYYIIGLLYSQFAALDTVNLPPGVLYFDEKISPEVQGDIKILLMKRAQQVMQVLDSLLVDRQGDDLFEQFHCDYYHLDFRRALKQTKLTVRNQPYDSCQKALRAFDVSLKRELISKEALSFSLDELQENDSMLVQKLRKKLRADKPEAARVLAIKKEAKKYLKKFLSKSDKSLNAAVLAKLDPEQKQFVEAIYKIYVLSRNSTVLIVSEHLFAKRCLPLAPSNNEISIEEDIVSWGLPALSTDSDRTGMSSSASDKSQEEIKREAEDDEIDAGTDWGSILTRARSQCRFPFASSLSDIGSTDICAESAALPQIPKSNSVG